MEPVGKHAWGTAKCGISLLKNLFSEVHIPNLEYKFLLARNPYYRMVSIYAEKVIDVNGRYAKEKEINENDYIYRGEKMRGPAMVFTQTSKIHLMHLMSFRQFLECIDRDWLDWRYNEHICRQVNDAPKFEFSEILFLEDLPECFERPKKELNMHFECTKENLKLLGRTDKGDDHSTPKLDSLNDVEEAWNKPATFWWDQRALPSNYDVMYNDELKEHVYDLYREDFEYFGLSK